MNKEIEFFINNTLINILGKKFRKELFTCSCIVFIKDTTDTNSFMMTTYVLLKTGKREYMYFNLSFKEEFFRLFPYKKKICIKLF